MKVTEDHFRLIKSMFTIALDGKKQLWEDNYFEKSETRKLWDLYWYSISSNIMNREIYNPVIREANYDDSHLQTAFKKAYNSIN